MLMILRWSYIVKDGGLTLMVMLVYVDDDNNLALTMATAVLR